MVNFTNIIRTTFMHADPKSAKKTVKLFALLGLAHVKAGCKHVDEIDTCHCPTYGLSYVQMRMLTQMETASSKANKYIWMLLLLLLLLSLLQ